MFRRNPELDRALLESPEMRKALQASAQAVADNAEQLADDLGAPWMPRRRSGTNRTFVVSDDGETIAVVNVDHGGHLTEWGSKNNPPHAPLRRSVQATGLRFRET